LNSNGFLALAALVAATCALAQPAPSSRPCSDPCFRAASAEFRDCTSSARGAFMDAVDGCVEGARTCVDACRTRRQDCRDGTGAGAALATCALERDAAKDRCRARFPLGSRLREICLSKAEIAHFRCRSGVRRGFLRALQDCRQAFLQCAGACPPGSPPGGGDACRAEGKAARSAALATCKQAFQVTARACFDKDVTCVQGCADARDACGAPTQATLTAALGACVTQETAALAACRAANPGGGPALDDCVTAVQAGAATCRDAALAAAAPGFAACAAQYVGCVRGCPSK
jgi:hypothetical protein